MLKKVVARVLLYITITFYVLYCVVYVLNIKSYLKWLQTDCRIPSSLKTSKSVCFFDQ